jgi:hypothetical protein
LAKLGLIRQIELPPGLFDGVLPHELDRYRRRVSTETPYELRPGLSHIRKQLEEEWPIPSCEVHLTGDGAWQRVRTQDVQRHASNDG